MQVYGFLLDELKFKTGKSVREFIAQMADMSLPTQVIAGTDDFNDNPYFGIVPAFTCDTCGFNNFREVDDYLVKTIAPYADMDETEIRRAIGRFYITSYSSDVIF